MTKQRVTGIKDGEKVDSYFSVKFKKPLRDYKYGLMFEIRLADLSGEMTAKYWGDADRADMEALHRTISTGDVVKVAGEAREFNGQLEIGIGKGTGGVLKALKQGEYDRAELLARAPRDPEEMFSELKAVLGTIRDKDISAIVKSFSDDRDWAAKLKAAPASMLMHSNYIGGLLEHTLNVVKLCDSAAALFPKLDRDYAIAGAFLHDIGKIVELEMTSNIDVTEAGMLRGHTVLGEEELNRRIAKIHDFPERTKLKLDHIVLSHHGKKEWGAPKEPQTPEAVLVHLADLMDAQLHQYIRIKEEASTEDKWVWDKRLGHVYLG
ncbi:MAG: HD domain-containing protein [Euryarchaeota archaeon]|nr:HD domain-containing protein [Euryarchaeota archaeon]